MKRKLSITLLALLIIASLAYSQTDDIFYSQSLLLELDMKSGFSITAESGRSRIDYVKVNFHFYPEESFSQDIQSLETEPKSTQKEDALELYWEKPYFGEHECLI